VSLQDEKLVIREIRRVAARMPAYAAAGAVQAPVEAEIEPPPDEPDELELSDAATPPVAASPRTLSEVAKQAALTAERALIEETLRQVHWNRRKAAQQLGVSYKTLLNKIKECGISRR
jgi:DNA-binding NtrC family response regulator